MLHYLGPSIVETAVDVDRDLAQGQEALNDACNSENYELFL
jgi:hypothetical protein